MAQAYVESYSQLGNREDLINLITNITPDETVIMSKLGTGNAKARTHEWMTESLQSINTANYVVEGATAAFASTDWTARVRVGNYTQIIRRPFSSSYTQDEVEKAGVSGSEFDHQRMLKTKELANDMNWHIINQTSATGASGTARQMNGIINFITTNTYNASGAAVAEGSFNTLLQRIWQQGGRPDAVFCHGFNKRTISGWTQPLTRNIDANGRTRTVTIDVYNSDFNRMEIYLERHLSDGSNGASDNASTMLLLDLKRWKLAFLRPLFMEELGKAGGQRRGYVESELTLEALAENSSGKITSTATA